MGYTNIGRETVEEFWTGQGEATQFAAPVLSSSVPLLKHATVRAASGNPGDLYVGPSNVAVGTGFILDAGDETPPIPIDDLSKLYVISSVTGTNEKQKVSIDSLSSSGSFTLSHGGNTTVAIDWNANATAVKTAIDNMGADYDVVVTGGPGPSSDWIVEFQGNLAAQDLAMMTGDGSSLVGGTTTVTITEDTKGDPAAQDYSWLAI